jgi:hypothetical protein
MKICQVCNKEFTVNEKYKSGKKRKCCSKECGYKLRRTISGNITKQCLNCNNVVTAYKGKYCSNKCQQEFQWKKIKSLIALDTNHDLGVQLDQKNAQYKKYLLEIRTDACEECGWKERNKYTNTTPLELEHIDGDCTNNKLSNLKILCPNCHSLTATYKGANKGNGSVRYNKWKKLFTTNGELV